eukprot:622347-Rhodomonas_salina.2
MPGTEVGYAASISTLFLRISYAMSGAESIDGIPTGGRSIQDIAEQIQSTSSDPSPSLSLSVRREEGGGELGTQSALQAPTGGRENGGGYNGGARKTERTLVVTLPRKSIKETGSVRAPSSLCAGYAMSGTDLACRATRFQPR